MINAPRGTKDILPPDSFKWEYVENKAKELFELYNYQQIRTPIFEYTNLFKRGIGENTDIVQKEMYTFEDKGGRSLTLRPEGTAPIVRSFMENKVYGQAQPTKYYYIGPMFRYERPQAGRYRQFHQIGVEALGSNDPRLDSEIISMSIKFLENLGLQQFDVLINSIGCKDCRNEFIESLKDYLENYSEDLCSDCQQRKDSNPFRVLDCKDENCRKIIANAPSILDYLCSECENHFNNLKKHLDILDITYQIEPTLVRGLDYYTNTAFEIKYTGLGAQDAIFGGGRYNGLTEEIGKKSIPGIGFAIGIERLLLALQEQEVNLPVDESIDVYITTIGEKAKNKAVKMLNEFRDKGLKSTMDYVDRSVGSQMKAADRLNANFTIIIGEEELNQKIATVRNMKSGKEKEIDLNIVVDKIRDEI